MYKANTLTGIDKPKSWGTCDGGKRNGIVTIEKTYAACVDQTAHHLTWALYTSLDHVCVGYDKGTQNLSSQSGMAEQPHYTIKEKMQFMLYATRLGTKFWVFALLHAIWFYNWQYHYAIKKKNPYKAFIGKLPIIESLFTWGCKVTAKKSDTRPTTITPHAYDGIFLGYMNTMLNLWYYDVHTGTIKYSWHDIKGEAQYGDSPDQWTPSSQHLIEVFTNSLHE